MSVWQNNDAYVLIFSLNILTIRRYIVEDLRKNPDDESAMSEEFIYPSKKPELPQEAIPEMSFKGLVSKK